MNILLNEKLKCKNCKERYIGCHSNCEYYNDFVAKNEKIKKAKKHYSETAYSNTLGAIRRRRFKK